MATANKSKSKKANLKNQVVTREKDGKWKKGHSGNPNGKPEGTLSLVVMLKKKLQEIPKNQKESYADLLIKRWINDAIVKGDANLLKEIVRYTDGMPKQTTEITGKDGEAIQINQLSNEEQETIKSAIDKSLGENIPS